GMYDSASGGRGMTGGGMRGGSFGDYGDEYGYGGGLGGGIGALGGGMNPLGGTGLRSTLGLGAGQNLRQVEVTANVPWKQKVILNAPLPQQFFSQLGITSEEMWDAQIDV